MATNKAVVMARGLGSRMKKDADASLTPDQAAAAASGAKAMMPLARDRYQNACVFAAAADCVREGSSIAPRNRLQTP